MSFVNIRRLTPEHFYLVPGVGARGGRLKEISEKAMTRDCGILVNASRAIIYASWIKKVLLNKQELLAQTIPVRNGILFTLLTAICWNDFRYYT